MNIFCKRKKGFCRKSPKECIRSRQLPVSIQEPYNRDRAKKKREERWEGRTQNVVTKLRVLQAQALELGFGLGAEGMRARGPEAGNGRAHRGVVAGRVGVHVAGVGELAPGRRVDAVDLGRGELLEELHAELLGEGVDARVAQEVVARVVEPGHAGVVLELALPGDLAREVLARVEELEEAAHGVVVFFGELNLSWLHFQVSECTLEFRPCHFAPPFVQCGEL